MKAGVADWAYAARNAPGEADSGDRHLVRMDENAALLAAIDGLGHGPEAARASTEATAALAAFEVNDSLSRIIGGCHVALQGTRGATMSLAQFDARKSTLTWLGVGNIYGRLLRRTTVRGRRDESLLLSPGLVGEQLPRLRELSFPLARGDVLVLATDGVDPHAVGEIDTREPPTATAERILGHGATGHDDALVLVARYMG